MALVAAGVGHIGVLLLLVPADPVRGRRTDEHFMLEAAAARAAGHDVAMVDQDGLAEPGGPGAVARVAEGGGRRRGGVLRVDARRRPLRRVRLGARVRELRGEAFTGGFVLRRFGRFTSAGARTWLVGGTCRLVTARPGTG